jgi:uncharacterized protein (TIGR02246 family)
MSDPTADLMAVVQRVFAAVDAMDSEAMSAMITDDAQGIDELSKGWMRGRAALESYFGQLEGMVDQVRSELCDVEVSDWGNAGVITCIVDQTYVIGGEQQHVVAPTSLALRREDGEWKIAVFHSAPLPE